MSGRLSKRAYTCILSIITTIFGIDFAKEFDTRLRFKKHLNLRYPKSLSDKVSYIELHEQSQLASLCTDKYAVREYVKNKGLEDILVPIYGESYTTLDDIDFNSLPNSFVIKATHGCKMNYLVPEKSDFDIKDCKKVVQEWMNTTYGTYSVEPHYINIPHRFYIEKYLGNLGTVVDYKIHCLNGEPTFILVISNRKITVGKPMAVTIDLFDMEWNPIPGVITFNREIKGEGRIPKPKLLDKMISVSRKLSEDFKFVRVDLYELNNKVYFGELTFSPACCVFPYLTKEFDVEMGAKLKI